MPRRARIKSCTGIYHVMTRGINHQNIFDSAVDQRMLLEIIHSLKQRPLEGNRDSDWMILSYALMSNHIHLLIKEGEVSIGDVVKKIAGAYVLYYNRKNRRDGHLFKERFKSEPCEDDDYFITLLRYIHQNPVKAKMVKQLDDYEFTSWHEFVNPEICQNKICNTSYVLERIDLKQFKELVCEPLSEKVRCLELEEVPEFRLSDNDAIEIIRRESGKEEPDAVRSLKREERNELLRRLKTLGLGTKQISRLTKLGISTVVNACSNISTEDATFSYNRN